MQTSILEVQNTTQQKKVIAPWFYSTNVIQNVTFDKFRVSVLER